MPASAGVYGPLSNTDDDSLVAINAMLSFSPILIYTYIYIYISFFNKLQQIPEVNFT